MALAKLRRGSTTRRRNGSGRPARIAQRIGRIAKSALTDEDTYVFGGIAGIGVGVGWVFGAGYGVIAASGAVMAFGVWLGYWRLSARPGGDK